MSLTVASGNRSRFPLASNAIRQVFDRYDVSAQAHAFDDNLVIERFAEDAGTEGHECRQLHRHYYIHSFVYLA